MIAIEFLSSKAMQGKTTTEKLQYIITAVKKGDKIVVLEESLSPSEETQLIQLTMQQVDKNFPGIEVATLGSATLDIKTHLVKLLGGRTSGLTVVGPSSIVKQIKKDPNKLNLLAQK
ncbi:MAG: DUF2073 domain-containing protein [Candidatus Micrarchaeota archaeon]|nr:DUF2073 domain-containing protein [Candidatus Micrarchaeota archaeon]